MEGTKRSQRNVRQGLCALLGCAAILTASTTVCAVTMSGKATTVVRLFELRHDLPDLDDVQYRPVDQLLSLSWDEIGSRSAWTIDTVIRGRLDLESDLPSTEEEIRLLVAEARWKSPAGRYTWTLGRQRTTLGLGWRAFDGAKLDYRSEGRWRAFALAGFPVELGVNGWPIVDGLTWGGGVEIHIGDFASLGADYLVRRDAHRVAEQVAGLDLHARKGTLALEVNADYSFPHEAFGDSTLVLSKRYGQRSLLEARVTRVEPTPAIDTVFAVYDINPYTEFRLSYERQVRRGLTYGLFVSHENYFDTGFPGPQDIDRAAATARLKTSKRNASHRAEAGWQRGFSGGRVSLRYDLDLDVAASWRLGVGASLSRYENAYRLTETDEEAAFRARITYDQRGRWDASVLLEQYLGRSRDTLRGTLVFTTKLGARRHLRPWWSPYAAEGWMPRGEAGPRRRSEDKGEPLETTGGD